MKYLKSIESYINEKTHKSQGLEINLVGRSRNPYVGKETEIHVNAQNIRCFKNQYDDYRFIYYNKDKPIAAMHIDKDVIMNIYTVEKYRRKGIMKKLYNAATELLGYLKPSKNLSDDGKAFFKYLKLL